MAIPHIHSVKSTKYGLGWQYYASVSWPLAEIGDYPVFYYYAEASGTLLTFTSAENY